jgi:hypothetical protein
MSFVDDAIHIEGFALLLIRSFPDPIDRRTTRVEAREKYLNADFLKAIAFRNSLITELSEMIHTHQTIANTSIITTLTHHVVKAIGIERCGEWK